MASCQGMGGKWPLGLEDATIQGKSTINGKKVQRSKGMRAYITKAMIGTGKPFSRSGPGWWSGLQMIDNSIDWHRGHLLGKQLGGDGDSNWDNMVPLYPRANDPAMEDCETLIRKTVEDCGVCLHFLATPKYVGTSGSSRFSIVNYAAFLNNLSVRGFGLPFCILCGCGRERRSRRTTSSQMPLR